MSTTVSTKWAGNMTFDALVTGHHIVMDLAKESGGDDAGPRPKAMLLASLMGCSGMDIVSILKKMKVESYRFDMKADGETSDDHPKVYTKIDLEYHFSGDSLPVDKIQKAVNLSTQKYCGVNAMLIKTASIGVKIFINEQEVKQ
ncbi:MAG TPA: OsmC family protein [Candidatus Cloacimonadota bacterium]|nr:OsmC family protein [Candidatus Cloacimonadota bacterium]HPI24849.1 OsmC family protein [Candidatus Cloacimonadota bacterium]